ncbi:MAG: RNA polymerase sigma factor [Halomonas sp.]|uniref:RNA polymerase sigma factor n=1 Tax=Halomonas sp. TaxID=1486246 RepID=UPI003F918CB2
MKSSDDDQLREVIPRLRRFALSLTRDPSNADDLVQSALEKAIGAWHQRHTDGDLRTWLFSILYRQFIDNRRRAGRYATFMQLFSDEPSTSASTEDIVVANATWDAFDKLPGEQRGLLMLASVEGLSYREISETLDIPMGTVMSRLSRARRALRELDEGLHTNKRSVPSLRRLK